VEAIRAHGHRDAHFVPDLDTAVARVVDDAREGDLILTLGAGNISSLGQRILDGLAERSG
jgi:UDP-N-acetylmuramate--alanine ligase